MQRLVSKHFILWLKVFIRLEGKRLHGVHLPVSQVKATTRPQARAPQSAQWCSPCTGPGRPPPLVDPGKELCGPAAHTLIQSCRKCKLSPYCAWCCWDRSCEHQPGHGRIVPAAVPSGSQEIFVRTTPTHSQLETELEGAELCPPFGRGCHLACIKHFMAIKELKVSSKTHSLPDWLVPQSDKHILFARNNCFAVRCVVFGEIGLLMALPWQLGLIPHIKAHEKWGV